MPTSIKVYLCEEDRNRFDTNFIRLKNLIKLNFPITCRHLPYGGIMVSKSASDKRHKYKQRTNELDRWDQENAEAISFGQFYRENYPQEIL